MDTTAARVARIMSEQLGQAIEHVTEDKTVGQLDGDSLDAVECVMCMEDEFGIEIPDADAERLYPARLSEWVTYIDTRLAAGKL